MGRDEQNSREAAPDDDEPKRLIQAAPDDDEPTWLIHKLKKELKAGACSDSPVLTCGLGCTGGGTISILVGVLKSDLFHRSTRPGCTSRPCYRRPRTSHTVSAPL